MKNLKKCIALLLVGVLSASMLCGCNKDNIDKFYATDSSSENSTSETTESGVDISKEYTLNIPDYRDYVELGQYIGVEYYINEEYYKVTDDMVVNRMCQTLGLSPTDVTDRGAKYGDTLIISFEGTVDGAAFDGNKADNYELLLGEGKLSISFEEQLVGVKTGDKKTVEYTFPAEYSDKTVAGKTAKFVTTINSVKCYKESDITESLLAEKTSYTKIDEYKAQTKTELEESVERSRKNDISTIILSKIADNTKVVKYDETRVNELIDAAKNATSKYAKDLNMTAEDYVKKYYGVNSYEEYVESLRPTAEDYLKSTMIISAIAYNENLNVTDEEYQEQIKTYVNLYGISREQLSTYYTAEDIVYSLLIVKLQDFLIKNGKQLDTPPAETADAASTTDSSSTAD